MILNGFICANCGHSIGIIDIEEGIDVEYEYDNHGNPSGGQSVPMWHVIWGRFDGKPCADGCGHSPSFGTTMPRIKKKEVVDEGLYIHA